MHHTVPFLRLRLLALLILFILSTTASAWTLPCLTPLHPLARRVLKIGVKPVYNKPGVARRLGEVLAPTGSNSCRGVYGVNVSGDLPFNRANRGNLMLYPVGEGNEPSSRTDKWL